MKKECWNKGYACENVQAHINGDFLILNVTRLIPVTRSENQKSRRVLEKAICFMKEKLPFTTKIFLLYTLYKI